MADTPKLTGSAPIHRRYTDPTYEPRPGFSAPNGLTKKLKLSFPQRELFED